MCGGFYEEINDRVPLSLNRIGQLENEKTTNGKLLLIGPISG